MKKVINFMNGKFGNRVLKNQYIYVWRFVTWGLFLLLVFRLMLCPLFSAWTSFVEFLNYVIWGV